MKKLLNINVLIFTLMVTLLSLWNFGYDYMVANFRGGQFFIIQEEGSVGDIKRELNSLATVNDVYVYTSVQNGSIQKLAVANAQKVFDVDIEGEKYVSNCEKCENSQNKIGEENIPRLRFISYFYGLDIVDNESITHTTFEVKGKKANVDTFITQINAKYDVSFPNLTYFAPKFGALELLIKIVLISIFVLYYLILMRDVKEISVLKLNGISTFAIYRKRVENEVFKVFEIWLVVELLTVLGMIFYQPNAVMELVKYQSQYAIYYFVLIIIILVSHLIINKLGSYQNFMGKNYFSERSLKLVSTIRIIAMFVSVFLMLFIGYELKPTINLFHAANYYSAYSDYHVATLNLENIDPTDEKKINQFANELYNRTVDKYNGIWIDNANLVDDSNCNEDKSNFDGCDSLMANANYLKGERIVDTDGKPIVESLNSELKTVIVPICKKDKFDATDLVTLNDDYDQIIYVPCEQQYHTFSEAITQKNTVMVADPVVYVVNAGDPIITKGMKYNGGYFINASEEQYLQTIYELDGSDYILKIYPKENDFYNAYSAMRNDFFLKIISLIIIISCIINIILVEMMVYMEAYGQEIRRKISIGYTIMRIFKYRMIINLIIMIISLISAIILSSVTKNFIPVYIMIIWIGCYGILEWRLLLNYQVWRKNE